jgi:hypothetical protein
MTCTTRHDILFNQTGCRIAGVSRNLKQILSMEYVDQPMISTAILNSAFSKSINNMYYMDKNGLVWMN